MSTNLISISSLSVNPPISDLSTVTSGMSWRGLSIILSSDIIVSISIVFKYSVVISEKTGIFASINSFSYMLATAFGLLKRIVILLKGMPDKFSSFIFFATNLASNAAFSITSAVSSFSSSSVSIILSSVSKSKEVSSNSAPKFSASSFVYSISPNFLLIILLKTKFVISNIFFLLLKFLYKSIFVFSLISTSGNLYSLYFCINSFGFACLNL